MSIYVIECFPSIRVDKKLSANGELHDSVFLFLSRNALPEETKS